ncbi:MAG: hypothetical protein RMI01_09735, partial [Thermodesulfovibrio sp.]|nr:hypothetical protein [Thermodesulfovibrio sp.]
VKNFYFFAYAYVSSSKFVSFAITPPSNLYSDTLKLNTRLAIYSENELFTQTTYKIRFSNQARVEIVTASSTYNILSTETYEEGWKYISGALRFISYLGQTFLLSQITVDSFYTTNPQFKRYAITPASLSATYTPALITNTNIYHCAFLYS